MFGFQVDHTAAEFTPFMMAQVCASLHGGLADATGRLPDRWVEVHERALAA